MVCGARFGDEEGCWAGGGLEEDLRMGWGKAKASQGRAHPSFSLPSSLP